MATLDIIYTTGAAETGNSLQVQLSFSHDDSTWVTETYASLSGGTSTLAPLAHSIAGAAAGTEYKAQLVIPFCSRYLKAQVKETGVAANYGTVSIILTTAAASGQERNAQSGGGDATAANQVLQLTQETAINSALAAGIPAANQTGVVYSGSSAKTPAYAFANVAASQTDSVIVASPGAVKIRVLAVYAVTGGTATNLTFNTKPAGAGSAISPLFANAANSGEVLPFSPIGWFETNTSEGLTVTTGAGSTTGIGVVYITV